MKKLRLSIFVSLALIVGMAYAYAQELPFAGKWKTTYGIIDIEVFGNQVNGTYMRGEGRITGTLDLDGRTLRGTWSEPPRPDQITTGDIIFTLSSDGDSFTGLMWYGPQAGVGAEWNGTRIE